MSYVQYVMLQISFEYLQQPIASLWVTSYTYISKHTYSVRDVLLVKLYCLILLWVSAA